MGDMADMDIESGEQEWFAHLAGECNDFCQYCEEEGEE